MQMAMIVGRDLAFVIGKPLRGIAGMSSDALTRGCAFRHFMRQPVLPSQEVASQKIGCQMHGELVCRRPHLRGLQRETIAIRDISGPGLDLQARSKDLTLIKGVQSAVCFQIKNLHLSELRQNLMPTNAGPVVAFVGIDAAHVLIILARNN